MPRTHEKPRLRPRIHVLEVDAEQRKYSELVTIRPGAAEAVPTLATAIVSAFSAADVDALRAALAAPSAPVQH